MRADETWIINGLKVVYNDEKHAYYVNDKRCISVTQLLKFKFPSKYDGVDPDVLKRAAEYGTFRHECVEMYELYGIESNEIEEFRNYKFLKDQFGFEVLENEIPIVLQYKDLIICGRLDMIIQENGKNGIADLKFTSVADKNYLAYQLNLYRLGYIQSYKKEVDILRGIHLKKDKRKYIELPINEEATYELLEDFINYVKEI